VFLREASDARDLVETCFVAGFTTFAGSSLGGISGKTPALNWGLLALIVVSFWEGTPSPEEPKGGKSPLRRKREGVAFEFLLGGGFLSS